MANQHSETQRSWWKLVLTGFLAFALGIAAVLLPTDTMVKRIVDVIFGHAKPLSGHMTAVAAVLALVAVVAIDGLVNLFGGGVLHKSASRIRGIVGVVVALAAVFWPGMTAYIAVELIGLWAILVGILELFVARSSSEERNDRALLIVSAVGAIVIGVGMMKWVFAGAVVVSAVVGVAAAARGVSLIVNGIHERNHQVTDKS